MSGSARRDRAAVHGRQAADRPLPGHASVGSTFGAAGSLLVFLVWVYYSAQILFFGAEFTQVYARRYGSRIVPAEGAVALTEEARAQQGIPEQEQVEQAAAMQAANQPVAANPRSRRSNAQRVGAPRAHGRDQSRAERPRVCCQCQRRARKHVHAQA